MATDEARVAQSLTELALWLPTAPQARALHPLIDWIEKDAAAGRLDDFTARGVGSFAAYATAIDRLSPTPANVGQVRARMRAARCDGDLWDVRLEMGVAAVLAGRGVDFRFGGPPNPEPDLVLGGLGLGIEVTRRAFDGPRVLSDALEAVAGEHRATVSLTFSEYPPQVRPTQVEDIVLAVTRALEDGNTEALALVVDTSTGPIQLRVRASRAPAAYGQDSVTIAVTSPLLSSTMEQAERAIGDKIRDPQKIRQAEVMPTILLVETSDIGRAWFRDARVWSTRLPALIPEGSPFLGLGVVQRDIRTPTLQATISLNQRSDAAALQSAQQLFRDLGLL